MTAAVGGDVSAVEDVVRADAALLEEDLARFLGSLTGRPPGAPRHGSAYAAALDRALHLPVADALGSKAGQEALRPHPGAPGGGAPLRPSMVYWAYRNYRGFHDISDAPKVSDGDGDGDGGGGDLAAVRRAAVAVRVLLKAAVALDDIQDGSTVRYGEPALHLTHGVPLALNTGSWLITAALAHAADPAVVECLLAAVANGFTGQAVDLATRSDRTRGELTDAPYAERIGFWESMTALKTGTLFRMPLDAALAALRVVTEERATLDEAMRQLGLASQLFNDVTDFVPELGGANTHEDLDALSNRVLLELLDSVPPDIRRTPSGERLRSHVLGHPDLDRTLLALAAEAVEHKRAAKEAVHRVCRTAESAAYFDITIERKGHLVDRLHDTLRQRGGV
ncbi:polyprenyl synthetase family protein [Streptomyces sp. IMTB 2501]|uniref:polyprenyl synthetase family protein n=1 Tax=Streptomyces sp. IMTB 2501 TaxID=1776340 RepID=UPI002117285E|nr:polyprenyl synthetase family protein [Streptomyces sp. IMTB 2501]